MGVILDIKNLNQKTILLSEKKTILQSLAENNIDWMQACGAKGRCTTCKMIILEGEEHLSPLTESENKFLVQQRLKPHERLACQAMPLENENIIISVKVPKIYQLPHIEYQD
ncbi:MAG: (2Fe-2S)-binding protein [Raineya sp.]|jgi:2Fe-2S ferredoxin|nr:(2Fe-2S)-binding protein [Raineya sp.]